MSDFLQDLELELVRAARRRSAAQGRSLGLSARRDSARPGLRLWAGSRLADLRDLASGGMVAASVGLVVVVLAVVIASGSQRAATQHGAASSGGAGPRASAASVCAELDAGSGGAWTAARSAPGQGLRGLLAAAAPATGRARTAALRAFDQTVAQATTVYVRDIRTVRLPGGGHITLIPAEACATVGMPAGQSEWYRPQASLLAEVESVEGIATIPLGTVAQIRTGAAYRSQTLLVKSRGGLSLVAMVPPGIVRVVCRLPRRAGVRRFPVVDHLVVMTAAAASGTCHLV